jgi:hypothetical protein
VAKFNFAWITGLEEELGIQLPFYGYVRNLGSRNTRLNKTSTLNGKRLFAVEDFLSGLSERALVELRKFDAHSPALEFGKHIGRTFFEENHFDRPELNRFL